MHNSKVYNTDNVKTHPTLQGFLIKSGVAGNGLYTTNIVKNINNYQGSYLNDITTIFYTTLTRNSWLIGGVVFYQDANYGSANQAISKGNYTMLQLETLVF